MMPMTKLPWFVTVCALAGCGASSQDELTQWMESQKKQTMPKIAPIAEPKQFKPVVQLTKAKEPEMPPEQELALLENDEKLLELLDKVDQGEILTGKDAKYFNAKTARHAELVALLGLDQDDFDNYMNIN